jgi:hypothetical protein
MSKIIDVEYYSSPSSFRKLDFKFEKPKKDQRNIYLAKLSTPLSFNLPISNILEIYQDDLGVNNLKFLFEPDENEAFLEFFYQLDNLALTTSNTESVNWFGKKLSPELLEKLYLPPYQSQEVSELVDGEEVENPEDIENEVFYFIEVVIDDAKMLEKLSDLDNDADVQLLVKLEGMRFFKKTFSYLITLQGVMEIPTEESSGEEENVDLIDAIASQDDSPKLENTEQKVEPKVEPKIEQRVEPKRREIIDKDGIEELANVSIISKNLKSTLTPIGIKENISIAQSTATKRTTMSKVDIESKLNLKREEAKKIFSNAERASRAAESLRTKALSASKEIKELESLLNTLDN